MEEGEGVARGGAGVWAAAVDDPVVPAEGAARSGSRAHKRGGCIRGGVGCGVCGVRWGVPEQGVACLGVPLPLLPKLLHLLPVDEGLDRGAALHVRPQRHLLPAVPERPAVLRQAAFPDEHLHALVKLHRRPVVDTATRARPDLWRHELRMRLDSDGF